jgi:hypothetical protein
VTMLLTGIGLVVDRFDESHPRQANLLYAMDADTRTAMWASQNHTRDPWTARYVPISNGEAEPPHPLPYRVTPRWTGIADVVPMDPPRIDVLASRSEGDSTEVRVRVASSRRANVVTIHSDRPVETATITADGQPPVTASPSYPDAAGALDGGFRDGSAGPRAPVLRASGIRYALRSLRPSVRREGTTCPPPER